MVDPHQVVSSLIPLVSAALPEIPERLRELIEPLVPHRALVIFTEDCTGRPQKKAGDPVITDQVTLLELDAVRRRMRGTPGAVSDAVIAGSGRPVCAWLAGTGALLVLCEPTTGAEPDAATRKTIQAMWEIAALRIRQQVSEAPASFMSQSHAVASERLRVTTELVDRHSTDLEAILAALRSTQLSDRQARASATELATAALIAAKTGSDVVVELSEEPVAEAFTRLRGDLRPLSRYGSLAVHFVEPPRDGRALPGEIAHAARAIVRSAILSMNNQDAVSKVLVQWDCDGTNLLIIIRDDGAGQLGDDDPGMRQIRSRAAAFGGTVSLDNVPDWGSDLRIALPLDPPRSREDERWDLAPREREVLGQLVRGSRNRDIARHLHISENTVKFHLSQLYRKLGVGSRAEAVALAVSAGSPQVGSGKEGS
ncbi:LuxR C-terminal-related transcriptional regulator [Corynebacterium variabile]|uniref:helix-turn-helix transcriptional regulator n=1 Tax=Corynebacterium variabile TaxID=1727 RepID=UPI0028EDD0DF|nr:LuxR family transcriptional regulator [Corynebacterium variabile]